MGRNLSYYRKQPKQLNNETYRKKPKNRQNPNSNWFNTKPVDFFANIRRRDESAEYYKTICNIIRRRTRKSKSYTCGGYSRVDELLKILLATYCGLNKNPITRILLWFVMFMALIPGALAKAAEVESNSCHCPDLTSKKTTEKELSLAIDKLAKNKKLRPILEKLVNSDEAMKSILGVIANAKCVGDVNTTYEVLATKAFKELDVNTVGPPEKIPGITIYPHVEDSDYKVFKNETWVKFPKYALNPKQWIITPDKAVKHETLHAFSRTCHIMLRNKAGAILNTPFSIYPDLTPDQRENHKKAFKNFIDTMNKKAEKCISKKKSSTCKSIVKKFKAYMKKIYPEKPLRNFLVPTGSSSLPKGAEMNTIYSDFVAPAKLLEGEKFNVRFVTRNRQICIEIIPKSFRQLLILTIEELDRTFISYYHYKGVDRDQHLIDEMFTIPFQSFPVSFIKSVSRSYYTLWNEYSKECVNTVREAVKEFNKACDAKTEKVCTKDD